MRVTSHDIAQKDPVHFRVVEVGPNPLPAVHPSDANMLRIEYATKPGGAAFGLSDERLEAHRVEIAIALKSQAVYWVSWDYSDTPTFPPRGDDTRLDRLFKAIDDGQIVPTDSTR